MNICITRSARYAYSETFIRDQISGLSSHTNVFPLHGGRYPEKTEDGKTILPHHLWLMHKAVKTFVGRNNCISDYGMKKFLTVNEIDVVLSNYGMSASHMVPACKSLKIPLIAIFHGHDTSDRKLLKRYGSRYRELFRYASKLIAVSIDMKMRLIDLGAKDEKIAVIPCGVNTEKFKPVNSSKKPNSLVSVGRLTEKKGPLHTIKSFYEVTKVIPSATLTMVGAKTGLYKECRDLVDELNLNHCVHFTGVLEPDDIIELFDESIGFLQHSKIASNGDMEGTPVSIMEASSFELPIISTLHGGIKDVVIHGETGFLVKEKDETQMAKHIITICKNPDIATKMGRKGRNHIKMNYEQQNQIQKIYNLTKNTVENFYK